MPVHETADESQRSRQFGLSQGARVQERVYSSGTFRHYISKQLRRIDSRITKKQYLRKLKFQFVEQNAKAQYITRIVSNIEDVPLVTDKDNKQLKLQNEGTYSTSGRLSSKGNYLVETTLNVSRTRLFQAEADWTFAAPQSVCWFCLV
ncbi:hypothetical protein PM082_004842 [Marasmius tenuissimus]|nr:hypothetical protein PM082_004842 [Marasmius tenuissimus]